jgi:NADPH:quinone reductase-like Zn-dependent oxidoreductase
MKGLVVEDRQICLKEGLELPMPRKKEVLVKVHCSSVTPFDVAMVEGKYDLYFKLYGFRSPIKTGLEFSGVVEQSGEVFKEGEKVFGYVDLMRGLKAHGEYIAIREDYMARAPSSLSFEEAASLPLGALTSYIALSELGEVAEGHRLLIIGAAGGLGVYAVQLGRLFGAHVTAVAGPGQSDFLHAMGAEAIFNYTQTDLKELRDTFDLILDLTAHYRFSTLKPFLNPKGRFIPADPLKSSMDFALSLFSAKKAMYMMVDKGDYEKLTRIADWVQNRKLIPVVDTTFALSDYRKAFERAQEKGRQGRVVLCWEGP